MSRKFVVIGSRQKGLFSNLLHTLQYLHMSESEGRIPIIHWDIYFYKKKNGDNVWDYYFEPVSEYSIQDIDKTTDDVIERNAKVQRAYLRTKNKASPEKESRIFVNGIISKYIKIKSFILDKIDNFYRQNMENEKVFGFHIRNKIDIKIIWEDRINFIKQYISQNPISKIFIASDSDFHINALIKEFGKMVIYYPCNRDAMKSITEISEKKYVEELTDLSQIKQDVWSGEESLIDCVLLSKCNFLLHGCSNVATCALYFNPDIDHYYIQEQNPKTWKDFLSKKRQEEIGYRVKKG